MPRLFTGLEVPVDVAAALANMRGGVHGARWIDPDDYHVTLRFIGDVDRRVAGEIDATLAEIGRAPVEVRFEGLGWFGGDRPRAIVARIKPDAALTELQSEHERRLRRIGLAPEPRNFTPHVTLARLRSVGPAAVADYLTTRGALAAPAFEASRFVLYSSRDSVGGGPYVVEAVYPLE
ncbi:MAG: RNA 2',3'-cyclic phosphodiesterase [Hyphomicrobiales bacterium]|nr:RNA 2',3'-cyclic phosphodiesterase [Hyphomicrobiales bacterium]MBV8661571.1 RNA 2',3'-cyclic phosphodiesterase [Hyphomicrobiales bacterium]